MSSSPNRRWRVLCSTAILVSLLSISIKGVGKARAQVPISALAASRSVPAFLDDHIHQTFVHPAWAVLSKAQFYTSNHASSSYLHTIGGLVGSGGTRLYFQSSGVSSDYYSYYRVVPNGRLQAGLAQRLGRLSLGTAIEYVTDDSDLTESTMTETSTTERSYEVADHSTKVLAGLGLDFAGGHVFLSGVVLLPKRELHWDRTEIYYHSGDPNINIDVVDLSAEDDPLYGANLRFSKSLGEDRRGTLVASWNDNNVDFTGSVANKDQSRDIDTSIYSETWYVAAAFEFSTDTVESVTAFASFEAQRPYLLDDGFGYSTIEIHDQREASVGVSIQQPLWRDIRMFSGARVSYVWEEESEFTVDPDRERSYGAHREYSNRFFGWGLAKDWKNLSLVGSVSNSLNLASGFLALDLEFRF